MRRLSVLAGLAFLLVAPAARADGDGAFSQLLREQGRGYGMASAGVGLAGRREASALSTSVTQGTLTLAGIPAGAKIRSAHLYWAIYGATVDTEIAMDGTGVTGQLIGTVGDTCWVNQTMYQLAGQSNRVYRADVTARITGNGAHVLTEFPTGPGDTDTQGASLVVVYEDTADTAIGTVIVHDGARRRFPNEFAPFVGTFDGFTPGKVVNAALRFGAGDGQSSQSDGDVEWNGASLPTPVGGFWGNSSGRYWDDRVFDLTTRLDLTKPSGTWEVEEGNDCVVLAYAALAYRVEGPSTPAGDAGPNPDPDGGGGGGSGGGPIGPAGDAGTGGPSDGGDVVIAAESTTSSDSGCGCGMVGTQSARGAGLFAAIGLALALRFRRRD